MAPNGLDHSRRTVPRIEAADTASEIDETIAVDILDDGAFGVGDEYWRGVICAADDGSVTAPHQVLGVWAGNWSKQSNG